MKISIAVIAHNEEFSISACIEALLAQSMKPTEIIVLLHNCTDNTKTIVQKFPVRTVECFEEGGIIVARARSIEACTGDIICCSDGDAWADRDWIKNITTPLREDAAVSIVGGYTKIQNSLFWKFSCWWQFVWNRKLWHKKHHAFAWGSNLAFRKKDYEKVSGLTPFLKIHKELELNYPAEDLYLSLALQRVGKISFATDAVIYTSMPPEKASLKAQKDIVAKQIEDNKKLFSFFKI